MKVFLLINIYSGKYLYFAFINLLIIYLRYICIVYFSEICCLNYVGSSVHELYFFIIKNTSLY